MSSRFAIAGLLVSSLVACEASDSGQTGSAMCAIPAVAPYCLCERLIGIPLRVRVVNVQSTRLSATIEEQYPSAYEPAIPLDPGEMVVGALPLGRPCDEIVIEDGVAQTSFDGVAGDELLVLYSPGENYLACAGSEPTRCGPASDAARLDGTFDWAVPFDAEVDFGAGALLAEESLATVLHDSDSCYHAFGRARLRCEDTVRGP